MKKAALIIVGLALSLSALASDVSVSIEHPRVGNKKKYTMSVNCSESSCQWQSKKHTGTAPLEYFARELNALTALLESGNVPGYKVEDSDRITAKIALKNNGRSTDVTLGSALDYRGDDSEKYSRINQLLVRLEFLIEKQAGKK